MNRELINTIRKTSTAPIPAVKAYKAENVASGNIKGVNRFSFNLRFGNRSAAESVDREALIRQANAVVEAHQWRMDTVVKKDLQARVSDWRKKRFMEQFNKLTETGRIDDVDVFMSGLSAFGADDEIYQQLIDKISDIMSDRYFTGFVADVEFKIQCAGLLKGIMQLLFGWEGKIGEGKDVARNIYKNLSEYFTFYKYEDNESFFDAVRENPLPAGSVVSEIGAPVGPTGHVYTTVGRDADGKHYVLEQAGLHDNVKGRWEDRDFLGNRPTIISQIDNGEQAYGMLPRISKGLFKGSERRREVAVPKGPAAKMLNDVYSAAMDKIKAKSAKLQENKNNQLGYLYTDISREAAKLMNPDLR